MLVFGNRIWPALPTEVLGNKLSVGEETTRTDVLVEKIH
jgi:hypothetical protein